jgi:hypothetical protein
LALIREHPGIRARMLSNCKIMKIKRIQLSEKDKRRAYKSAVRKATKESGADRLTVTRVYRNRKKYTREGRNQIIRKEEKLD